MAWLKAIWRQLLLLILWQKQADAQTEQKAEQPETPEHPAPASEPPPVEVRETPAVETSPASETGAAPPAPPLAAEPPPPIFVLPPHRKEKWVTPKPDPTAPSPVRTILHHKPEPKPWQPPKPKPERIQLTEDPEQWGQYYFRDVILDQLDRYWIYLRRMKHGDKSAYGLLHQVGIQLVPWSATRGFDKWREDSAKVELSPWWREHRPGFGAIAYGFDEVAKQEDELVIVDPPDPNFKLPNETGVRFSDGNPRSMRPFYMTKSKEKYDKRYGDAMAVWSPRFLYFQKYDTPPTEFERLTGGDTYAMTVYWDRCDEHVSKRWRAKNHGGVAQEYGVFVEHGTGRVRVLKMKIHERVEIKWAKGPYGGKCTEPTVFTNTHWDVPDRYLLWAHRDLSPVEPEDYLRRLFIEAANMYESAVLGSMIRVAVTKAALTATFGVEVKRMAHFFKDRDVRLTVKGRVRPVFHVVRPHTRKTKNGEIAIKMHFSGLREFEWAGYHVSISVPGLHHFPLPEFTVGSHDLGRRRLPIPGMSSTEQVGKRLASKIKQGWHK